jgi:hypothetical protein
MLENTKRRDDGSGMAGGMVVRPPGFVNSARLAAIWWWARFPQDGYSGSNLVFTPHGTGYSHFREVLLNLKQSIETTLTCDRTPRQINDLDPILVGK